MVVFLEKGFNVEAVFRELLNEQKTQPKCGYFQLRLVSDLPTVNFLRLFCNDVKAEDLKEDLLDIQNELRKIKAI